MIMAFTRAVDPEALDEIQLAIDYYEFQQPGLGRRFEATLDNHFQIFIKSPFFRIR